MLNLVGTKRRIDKEFLKKLKLRKNYVLVEVTPCQTVKQEDNIYFVDNSKRFEEIAKVIKVGPGTRHPKSKEIIEMQVKEGDTVYISNPAVCDWIGWTEDNKLIGIIRESSIDFVLEI